MTSSPADKAGGQERMAMLRIWNQAHHGYAFLRWPAKLGLFGAVAFLALFPDPWRARTLLTRVQDMEQLLDPAHPALAPLERQARAALTNGADGRSALRVVEKVVYEHVPYSFDWQTWGVVEWLPTVAEVFEKGREDCDGRAVVAASLLRRMGYEAWLVTDILHMWVETPIGETMAPTSDTKVLAAGKPGTDGTIATVDAGIIAKLARGFSFGVAVFPLPRELIIVAALALLTLHPRLSFWRGVAGCLLLWIGLDTVRSVGEPAARHLRIEDLARVWLGVAVFVAGWLILAFKAAALRPDSGRGLRR